MSESSRIPDTHAEAWALLPFLANGRMSPEDREWVELHLQSCAECRRELEEQRALAAHMREAPVPFEGSEQRAFNKLWARIEAAENAIPAATQPRDVAGAHGSSRTVRWLAAAVIVQAIGLATLGFATWNRSGQPPSAEFRTVTTTAPQRQTGEAVRVVFAPETPVSEVNELLAGHGLEIVSGPGEAGVFTAALSGDSTQSAAAVASALESDSRVHFAQPVMR